MKAKNGPNEDKFLHIGRWPLKKKDRLKITCMKVVRIQPKKCNLLEELVLGRLEWRNIIHVADTNILGARL